METVSPWLFRKDLTLTCLDSTRGVKWPALGVVVGRVVVRAWNPVGGGGFNDDKCLMFTPKIPIFGLFFTSFFKWMAVKLNGNHCKESSPGGVMA